MTNRGEHQVTAAISRVFLVCTDFDFCIKWTKAQIQRQHWKQANLKTLAVTFVLNVVFQRGSSITCRSLLAWRSQEKKMRGEV